MVLENGISMVAKGEIIFVGTMSDQFTFSLLISSDHGSTFKKVEFPVEFDEYEYRILGDYDHEAFVSVVHHSEDFANLYVADDMDEEFVLSLRDVYRFSEAIK